MNACISIININYGIKELTRGYQNFNTSQIMVFGGYVKVRESLYMVNTSQHHINTIGVLT